MTEIKQWFDANNNSTVTPQEDFFYKCWILPNCETCLNSKYACSWCATSQVCVPNDHFNYPFGLLAPIKYQNICPLAWRERWEMRAKPFSCRCSTMTLMSVVVSVLSTLAAIFLIWLCVRFEKWLLRKWKNRQAGWWRLQRWWPSKISLSYWLRRHSPSTMPYNPDEETRPLLSQP